jgi:hypothetical protein
VAERVQHGAPACNGTGSEYGLYHLVGPTQWCLPPFSGHFDTTWPVIRAREGGNDKARMAELSMALSCRLAEFAANGVTDPHELQRLALETFPLTPPPQKETAPGGSS